MPRYSVSVSRKKACVSCSEAKLRCDRNKDTCARCLDRGIPCRYSSHERRATRRHEARGYLASTKIDCPSLSKAAVEHVDITSRAAGSSTPPGGYSLDTTQQSLLWPKPTDSHKASPSGPLERDSGFQRDRHFEASLVCPIVVEEIKNRWLTSYIPNPDQPVKQYSTLVIQFISRVLRSYVGVSVNSQGRPAFVHHTQVSNPTNASSLHTCLNLVRVLAEPPCTTAMNIIEREMEMLYRSFTKYNQATLLAAFQAYLIYAIGMYFWSDETPMAALRQAIINLQDLACASSRQGLVCLAEQRSTIPDWQSWIEAESKRRTLYTMYMFDSILSAKDGLPSHLATELFGLPAPSKKDLWEARTRQEWETLYMARLVHGPVPDLQLNELWPAPANPNQSALFERRKRVDGWLEGVDEFGTMLFTVTSFTHGS